MRKKIFTFLLALAASVGMSWATTITWDDSKVYSMAMNVSSGSDSRTSDGITVTAVSTGEFVVFGDHDGAIEIGNGEGSGGGYITFESSVGNITRIDINHYDAGTWSNANAGWPSPYYETFDGGTFTWSGTPAASVTLTGDAPRYIWAITSIVFTIEDGGGSTNPSGSCGTNLSWEFNPSTGTLTITGSGAMSDWENANSRPWNSYKSDITSLSLPEGLTYIGRSAFQECQMTSVELPNSLEEIGRAAFCACGLTSVTIPDNVHTIGWSAFASCQNLSTITIGSGVTSIGYFAFSNLMIEPWPSRQLESVTCYATTPPTCDYDESFSELWNKEQVPLYVPAESVNAYKAAEDWNGFDVQAISGGSTPTEVDVEANVDPHKAGVYYSTFYDSSNKYELPSGVEAFVADLSGSDLVLTKIAGAGQVIPADNAVILKANSDNITLTQTDDEAVSFSANNDLEGVDAVTTLASLSISAEKCYVLSGSAELGVGFYKISGSSLKAHKAYVIYDGEPSGAPRRIRFVFDQATGVESIQPSAVSSQKMIENGQLVIIRNGVKYNAQGQIVK